MKGRSNRLPPPSTEDWGDGSWTVDCSCGVTFDDGDEMVNCDLCGVWVHTRCSRYVKGEASFNCDKCKGKINGFGGGFLEREETEVAQLLAELPTKADQRAIKLWTRAPIEERVHVHGVPGGDPDIFKGFSSVFSSGLWKCAGYVAKKFNFKYKDFPCWDEEDEEEKRTSRGADLLFSLSKDVVSRKDVKISSPGTVLQGKSQFYARKERSRIRIGKKKSKGGVDCKKRGSSAQDLLRAASAGLEHLKGESRPGDNPLTKFEAPGSDMPVKIENCDRYDGPKVKTSPKISTSVGRSDKPGESLKEEVEDLTSVIRGKQTCTADCDNTGDTDEISSSGSLKSEKQTTIILDIGVFKPSVNNSTSMTQVSSRIKPEEDLVLQETPDKKLVQSALLHDTPRETASVCSRLNSKIDEAGKVLTSNHNKQLRDHSPDQRIEEKPKSEARVPVKDDHSASVPPMKQEERVKPVLTSSASSASNEARLISSAAKLILPLTNQNRSKSPCPSSSSAFEKVTLKEKVKIKTSTSSTSTEEMVKGLTKSHSKSSQHVPRSEPPHTKSLLAESGRRNEKITVAISHLSPGSLTNPSNLHLPSVNASSALSDEELARLLHQELNSSPRVPRVPRARQPERLLSASGSSASLLSKSSGGRDQAQASRRKNREDSSRDRSRSTFGLGGETRKGERLSCPDERKEEQISSSRRGGLTAHNGVSSSSKKTEIQVNSPAVKAGNPTDGGYWSTKAPSADPAAADFPTLPGLIDEIMGKGNCATYDELCNAVLPHWKNLRKPNGDKYAYSSHSQAVLDCLRNRSQWSHLIDRGPKTNSSRKRGKAGPDSDPSRSDSESEDSGDEGDSHRDGFPKGRRNARKRRRLVLGGRVLRVRPNNGADLLHSSASSSSGDGNGDGYSRSFSSADVRRPSASNSSASLNLR